ncbi:MAG: BrnA antitoxin family protein [Marinobacter sp.]|uniref:BrnA antitoxin family protein n=1 Tax=Marinobacter sp. TaxID=50741 RepID=UPI003F9D520B
MPKLSEARRLGGQGDQGRSRPSSPPRYEIDEDVIEFFKSGGSGWQTRMNEALRQYIRSTVKK